MTERKTLTLNYQYKGTLTKESRFRFVLQKDGRFILQENTGVDEPFWAHINVVLEKDVPGYKAIKLPNKPVAKPKKVE